MYDPFIFVKIKYYFYILFLHNQCICNSIFNTRKGPNYFISSIYHFKISNSPQAKIFESGNKTPYAVILSKNIQFNWNFKNICFFLHIDHKKIYSYGLMFNIWYVNMYANYEIHPYNLIFNMKLNWTFIIKLILELIIMSIELEI